MSKVFVDFISKLTLILAGAALLFAFAAPDAEAQSLRGSVTGTVVDPQDKTVGDVQVKVTNQGTGISTTITTNALGIYRVSALDPGIYTAEFSKQGFESKKVQDIQLSASQEKTISLTLSVSAISTTINVTDVPGTDLSKTNPTIQISLPAEVLDNTPMTTSSLVPTGTRNFLRFPLLAPNVARVPGQNETAANGHNGRQNNYMLDGVNNNDSTVTLPALFTPPEAIQEVHVQVAPFSAEFGKNIGAQVNVITRAGSNSFHGEGWDFFRSNALEPLSLQRRKAGLTRNPKTVNHQFGGSLGGPIMKDRTFFFGLVQGYTARETATAQPSVTIPTPTGYAALASVPLRSGTPAQSAASRQAILDAIAFLPDAHKQIKNYDTTSTVTVNGVPIEVGTFVPVIPQNQNGWYSVLRADHRLSANDQLSYRVHLDDRKKPLNAGNLSFGDRFATDSIGSGQNHALSYIRTISNSFVNEARLAYTRLHFGFENRENTRPTIVITNFNTVRFGSNENFPQARLEQNYQFQNTATYIQGRQSLRFGVDVARIKLFNNVAAGALGRWIFQDLAGFMNNQATQALQIPPANRYSATQTRQAYFVQDDVKVTRNLTANIGLRYETASVPLGYFGATDAAVLAAVVPAPTKRDSNNWAPRLGFAYNSDFSKGFLARILPAGKSTIRGGFGMAYDQVFLGVLQSPSGNYPRNTRTQITTLSQLLDVYPNFPAPSSTLSSTTVFTNLPADAQAPTTSFWTLSVQRQVAKAYSVEVGYSGSHSYHLLRQGEANPGVLSSAKAAAVVLGCTTPAQVTAGCENPTGFPRSPSNATATDTGRINAAWASRALFETSGSSEYHGGYVRLERKLTRGITFGLNYTWSANLSDTEDILITDALLTGSSPLNPQDYLNRRNDWARSTLDRPHRFSGVYSYNVPGFKNSNAILRQTLSGWQVSGFTEVQSGQPYTIIVGTDTLGSGLTGSFSGRPNYNPAGIMDKNFFGNGTFRISKDGTGIVTAPNVVNTTTGAVTFLKNSMPAGGNLGRNTFRGPGFANTNLSLQKKFELPHEMSFEIRSDFINLFNHDSFANPDANMSSATFGRQTQNPLTDARQVVLGAKLAF